MWEWFRLFKKMKEMTTLDQVLVQFERKNRLFWLSPDGLSAALSQLCSINLINQFYLHQGPSAPLRKSIRRLTRKRLE